MENKISDNFLNKIRRYFFPEWIFFSAGIILLIYYFLNLCNLFVGNNINLNGVLFSSLMLLTVFVVKYYFISQKIKRRLIYKIQQNDKTVVLITYNKSTMNLNKSLLPLQKEPPDYFINTLFSSRMGAIHQDEAYEGTCIVKIDGKKYYLTPNLFEHEVTI